MLADAAGLKMSPVSYRASNQSIQDLIGGQIKVACDNYSVAIEQVRSGNLRAVAITSPAATRLRRTSSQRATRSRAWSRCRPSAGSRPAACPRRSPSVSPRTDGVGKLPEVRAAMEKFGVIQTELDGAAYAAVLAKERAMYARIIEKAGIKVP